MAGQASKGHFFVGWVSPGSPVIGVGSRLSLVLRKNGVAGLAVVVGPRGRARDPFV